MRMYPFWKLEGEEGIYRLTGFSCYVHDWEKMAHRQVIWLFEHMGGGLNAARPSWQIKRYATEADRDEVLAEYPEAWEEWANLPEENV